MKRRKALWVVGLLVLIAGGAFLFWPRKSPPLRLEIVRQTVQQGKPIVFFQLKGGPPRRIQIVAIQRQYEESPTTQGPLEFVSEQWLLYNPVAARKQFGIAAPVATSFWRLQVWIATEVSPFQRLRGIPTIWKSTRNQGVSFPKAARYMWSGFIPGGSQTLESDIITNAVPEPAKLVDR